MERMVMVILLFPCAMIFHGCGGGDVSGNGLDTGSFLTAQVFGRVDDCTNSGFSFEAGFNCPCLRLAHAFFFNRDLPFQPGGSGEEPSLPDVQNITVLSLSSRNFRHSNDSYFPSRTVSAKSLEELLAPAIRQEGETGGLPSSRHITIDRYTVEYIPSDALSPPLSSREFFQTIQIPPQTDIGYEIIFMDLNTKEEFESFVEQNPTTSFGNYTAVFRFFGHNDLGAEVQVAASDSFVIGRLEACEDQSLSTVNTGGFPEM
ncbi:MAG: hypothetical protein JRG73_11605 [Deltaproteobacteria bacterium]|nr:hypothetical protein [Deltaproteobacteria bacterium]